MKKLPAFFIQARLSSTRFYQKVITPIKESKAIIDLILERIRYNFPLHKVYVLTTSNGADDLLIKHLEKKDVQIFRGSEENVLDRFIAAGEVYDEKDIVRVCADNPFLLPAYLAELINSGFGEDYLSFSYNQTPIMKCHFGFFAERITLGALKKAAANTKNPLYLEHVTNYIYENSNMFRVRLMDKTNELKSVAQYRLTVDTPEDFQTASTILSKLNNLNDISVDDIKNVVDGDMNLYKHMAKEKIKNSK